MRAVYVSVAESPVESMEDVFSLAMADSLTGRQFGVCSQGMPDSDKAERMFEKLWEKHEKSEAVV